MNHPSKTALYLLGLSCATLLACSGATGSDILDPAASSQLGTDPSGASARDAGLDAHDSGAATSADARSDAVAQSGDCVGIGSAATGITYDKACDTYYMSTFESNPCTPGANDCQPIDGHAACCYRPTSNTYCNQDYGGLAQCVPR